MLDERLGERFGEAAALEAAGRPAEAAVLWREILARHPALVEAHFNLGNALLAQGRAAEAAESYQAALALQPEYAEALLNLGIALKAQGQAHAAIAAFRSALRLRPGYPEAHNSLGNALHDAGRLAEAEQAHREAIRLRPQDAAAQLNLGRVLAAQSRWAEAAEAFRAAGNADPDLAAARFGLGEALMAQGALAAAAEAFAALTQSADAQVNAGNALHALGRDEAAVQAYLRALRLRPEFALALSNLACPLHAQGQYDMAIDCARAAIRLDPSRAAAHSNLGNNLAALGRSAEAVEAYRSALRLQPAYADAWSNLGAALRDQGRVTEAILACRTALEIAPDVPEAHFNLSLSLLTAGQFEEGWAEHEWRWRTGTIPPRGFAQPQWNGEALGGRRILLHAEQGLGDTLQFVRYAPLVAQSGGRVILEVQPPLVGLLRRLPGVETVLACGEALPDFDLHCPMMSLPHAFGTRLDTIPASIPYLAPDPGRAARWARRLPRRTGLMVGIVWAGSPRPGEPRAHQADRRRSMRLDAFASLAGVPGVRFVSLQHSEAARQLRTPPPGMRIFDPMPEVADFEDTAAIVAELDLVIAVDTSVAHLAGALGRPVWLLSRFDGCWRWLTGRDESPWYPGMRIFRQERPGGWAEVMEGVASALRRLAGG